MSIRVGIVGVSGYGGGEALRLLAGHPEFKVVYVAGESSAGSPLIDKFPGIGWLGDLTIEKWDPLALPQLDVLFASLPSGQSREALALVSSKTSIIDIGGDHRYVDGWTYGLADVWPDKILGKTRIANPGCYPSAALTAIAPLMAAGIVRADVPLIIDAKSGVSGAGRGGGATFGFADVNEDVAAYGLTRHAHVPEMIATLNALARTGDVNVTFTPHLIPMTRGILATSYVFVSADITTERCLQIAREFYRDRPFVRVVDKPPHTKWALGSNLVFISYFATPGGPIIAFGAIDNLGKGAAGQAVQNANLITGQSATAGLLGAPLWP